ncbi:Kinase-like domain-containing protein [Tolypocladium paradoxum]|uniref:Kinase-like domain-containing protein n=1 Tax=Tolypocladium paradoxum TaxID=94208 RepID=A0A2S4KLL2_9HYPO|nr:Kinase-like domain-containing protein [Tolypocladium paradoxum]
MVILSQPDMDPPIHVRDSVKQIDKTSWLVGSKHVLRHVQGPRREDCLWENSSDGSYYTLSAAPVPPPDAGPLAPDGHALQIHDAGDVSAVFSFGDALIIKVRIANDNTRREPETLAFLAQQQLSFDIPTVLFYTEDAGKTYLVEPCAPGKRLNEAWWEMPEEEKEHVVTRVSEICAEIKVFRSSDLTGVDYNWLDPLQEPGDQRVEVLQQHCKELGMDCSVFVLSHNDLGPTNIIINGNRIVVLDWEMAGYAPLEWVRTKFAICGALCVERVSSTSVERNSEYPVRVEQKLGEMGFPEVTEAYNKRDKAIEEEWERNRH